MNRVYGGMKSATRTDPMSVLKLPCTFSKKMFGFLFFFDKNKLPSKYSSYKQKRIFEKELVFAEKLGRKRFPLGVKFYFNWQHIAAGVTTRCDICANGLSIVYNILYLVEELTFVRVRN